jgi:hypothetical protein
VLDDTVADANCSNYTGGCTGDGNGVSDGNGSTRSTYTSRLPMLTGISKPS